jgi:ribosomal protein S18 acetylase RimI-like enzyme
VNRYLRAAARLARTLPGELAAGWRRAGPAGLRQVLRARIVRRVYRRLDLLLLEVDVPEAADGTLAPRRDATARDERAHVREPVDGQAPPEPEAAGVARSDAAGGSNAGSDVDARAAAQGAGPTGERRGGLRISPFSGPWSRLASMPGQVPIARLEEWSRGGMTCLLAERDGTPVGYVWVDPGFRGSRYPAAPELPPDAVYLRNLFVLGSERGRGLGTALVRAGLRAAAQSGRRRVRYTVRPDNDPSLGAFRRAAGPSRVLGRLCYVRVLDRRLRRYVPVSPDPPG